MVSVKVCEICGLEYKPNSSHQKYCSNKCLEKGNIRYYKNKFQSFARTCVWCGKEFKGTKTAKWCCDECKQEYQTKERKRRQKERQDRLKYAFDSTCQHCGKEFKGTKYQKYCSEDCRCEAMQKFNREKAIRLFREGKNLREIARELNVGATTVKRVLRQYGIDTSKNYINTNKKIAEENFKLRLESITKLFSYSHGYSGMRNSAVIKCNKCGHEFEKNPNSILSYKEIIVCPCCRVYDHNIDRTIQLKALIERDHNKCHICGDFCDINDTYINETGRKICGNNYPTIDHVVPRSKGGRHVWNNVKLAHRRCNSIKGSKV